MGTISGSSYIPIIPLLQGGGPPELLHFNYTASRIVNDGDLAVSMLRGGTKPCFMSFRRFWKRRTIPQPNMSYNLSKPLKRVI